MQELNYAVRMHALSDAIAEWSRNRGTKVGAVIFALNPPEDETILAVSCNKLPRGMDENRVELHHAPLKGIVWEHAERGAIFAAAREGVSTRGRSMAVNWYPCAECARAVVEAGIVELIASEPDWTNEKWNASWLAAKDILESAQVRVIYVERPAEAVEGPKAGKLIEFPDPQMIALPPLNSPLQPLVS